MAKDFSAVELVIAKREKQELSTEQINWLVDNYTKGIVADEQMSAMAMAILLNGMNRREITDLTLAMITEILIIGTELANCHRFLMIRIKPKCHV